jgi:predicted HTH transcriptional regulator
VEAKQSFTQMTKNAKHSLNFEQRMRASAILCEMLIDITAALQVAHNKSGSIAASWTDWQLFMMIRVNDDRGLPPLSQKKISEKTGIPRRNIGRWMANLIKNGAVKQSDCGSGYIIEEKFIRDRLDAPYFADIMDAIERACCEMKKLKKK